MLRRTSRIIALLLAAMAVLFLGAAPAMAGEYTPPPDIDVDDPNPDRGDTITISGESCNVGAEVTIFVDGAEVGTTTVGEDGTFSFEYTVPNDTTSGTHEIEAHGCTAEVLGTTFTVGDAAAPPGALPATGSSSTEPLVRTGAVLVAAGAVLVYAVRRRQQATAR